MTTSRTCRSLEEPLTESLVETHWLKQNLEDPNIRVIEIDPSPLPPNHCGHIPNSILLDWKSDLWDKTRRDFITDKNIQNLMERSGIFNNTMIICCSLVKQFSTYLFWILKYNKHQNVKVLNGGLEKWISDRLPLNKRPKRPRDIKVSQYVPQKPNSEIRAFRDYIIENLNRENLILIDARTAQEYCGELINVPELPQEGSFLSGRIPGAINIFFEENLQPDGRFKIEKELRQIYLSRGITPEKEIIVYCRSGHRASLIWFVLTHLLGYPNVKIYDGSWTEWGNLVNVPIEKLPI